MALRNYEALLIFVDSLNDDDLDKAMDRVCEEIKKQGGETGSVDVMGNRLFARPMKKQDNGIYVRLSFMSEPASIDPLNARFKLNEDIFRVQITTAPERVQEEK